MSAQPAYDRYTQRWADSAPASPQISVIRGGNNQSNTLSPTILFFARAAAIVFIVLAVLGFVRIGLSSATVAVAMQSQEVMTSIDHARTAGSTLEVQQSALSNPDYVKEAATALGMAAPDSTQYVNISDDVVATDEDGHLSLSESLRKL